jgi:hypothetical protein
MGTQQSLVRFTGKVGDVRGYKRLGDKKGRVFIGNAGGANKATFTLNKNMEVTRNYAQEFQGCILPAFDIYNYMNKLYFLKGLDFKQRFYKEMFNLMQIGTGTFGQRQLLLGDENKILLPMRIGENSFESICSNESVIGWSSDGSQIDWTVTGSLSADQIKHSPKANAFNIRVTIFTVCDWVPDVPYYKNYIPSYNETVIKRNYGELGITLFSALPFTPGVIVNNNVAGLSTNENAFAIVGIFTGYYDVSNFTIERKYSGSSIISSKK